MFSGIITDIGTVKEILERKDGVSLWIATSFEVENITLGASIACDGACMTVTEVKRVDGQGQFLVDVSAASLAVTTLRDWSVGHRMNLEPALKMGDELGGHIVSGHVDDVAKVAVRHRHAEHTQFKVELPGELARYVAVKGSITLNGVSLTVNGLEGNVIEINLVPHTVDHTNLGELQAGDSVNVEIDMMARYIARMQAYDATMTS